MENITLGDWIGYIITLVVGFLGGVLSNKYFFANKSNYRNTQSKNILFQGDIVGGNKNDKKD